MIVIKLTP